MNGSRSYGFLIETLLALLFFALSAAVLLQTFWAAGEKSDRTALRTVALISARSLLEESLTDGQPRSAVLEKQGVSYEVQVLVEEQPVAGGTLLQLEALALDESGQEILSAPLRSALFVEGGDS